MKVAVLAGGFGTRLSEETAVRPKPMVDVGGRPILWHIMKIYASYGFKDFVVLGGYKVDVIRDYFMNYRSSSSDFTISMSTGHVEWHGETTEDWNVTVLDTGADAMTGGRLKAARKYLENDTFCLTYGDGVSDVDIPAVVQKHKDQKNFCTLTAVTQPGRYGALRMDESGQVEGFREKGAHDGGLINGGFFVCEPDVFDLIDGPQTVWEAEPMDRMIEMGKLGSYHHEGFWQSMDSLRDRKVLEDSWATGKAPWKLWA
jgi:glucose-1-phosphate cytidylyltransferase